MTKRAAIIGGGVIGGGWAARFLLNGWDVCVSDPDPEAERKISAVLDNARRSLPSLMNQKLPAEGRLRFCGLDEAVAGADWVQESVPERLDIKHAIIADIQAVNPDALLASSTSGFKPSELAQGAAAPDRIIVAHPFNPVYLLPLIELVGPEAARNEAAAHLDAIGMKPLHVRREIDAHIADRFLEAVWREGLWLIKDDIATTEEIDDAIRFGFGLRWAQMGLFETYRIAGGEAGMAHFIAQFGPCLSWPWTKLMDVPDLSDELIDKIASQSDAQSGAHSIRELERIRDDNLVGMMRALKHGNWGAGAVLNAHDAALTPTLEIGDLPVQTIARAVPQSWTDYNGHMNEAHYGEVFSNATDALMVLVGADEAYVAGGQSYFTAECHIRYLNEVNAGDAITVETQVLNGAGKKMHLFHRMLNADGDVVATGEYLLIHVDLSTRASSVPGGDVAEKLGDLAARHAALGMPEGAGRFVGERR